MTPRWETVDQTRLLINHEIRANVAPEAGGMLLSAYEDRGGVAKPVQYYGQIRPEMLAFVPDAALTILEVGCGVGRFGAQLRRPGRRLVGIEIDREAAIRAKDIFDEILVGSIEEHLPHLEQNSYDCIVFNDVLEHMVDPYSVLENVRRLLSETGGCIVASIPNVRYFFNVRELLVERQWRYRDYGIMDRTHLRFFTKLSIQDMFTDAGYNVARLEGINGYRSWKFSLLNAFLIGAISDMRYEQFACVATLRG